MENRGTDLGHLAGRLVAGLSKSWLSRIQNFARLRVTASIRRHWHRALRSVAAAIREARVICGG
jgi:hypothetical protein